MPIKVAAVLLTFALLWSVNAATAQEGAGNPALEEALDKAFISLQQQAPQQMIRIAVLCELKQKLEMRLLRSERFRLVSRPELEQLLTRSGLNLQDGPTAIAEQAPQDARVSEQVDGLLCPSAFGQIRSSSGRTLLINLELKLYDLSTGNIAWMKIFQGQNWPAIKALLDKAGKKLPPNPAQDKYYDLSRKIVGNLESALDYGMTLAVKVSGPPGAAESLRRALQLHLASSSRFKLMDSQQAALPVGADALISVNITSDEANHVDSEIQVLNPWGQNLWQFTVSGEGEFISFHDEIEKLEARIHQLEQHKYTMKPDPDHRIFAAHLVMIGLGYVINGWQGALSVGVLGSLLQIAPGGLLNMRFKRELKGESEVKGLEKQIRVAEEKIQMLQTVEAILNSFKAKQSLGGE